jgi:hypothetical protein
MASLTFLALGVLQAQAAQAETKRGMAQPDKRTCDKLHMYRRTELKQVKREANGAMHRRQVRTRLLERWPKLAIKGWPKPTAFV